MSWKKTILNLKPIDSVRKPGLALLISLILAGSAGRALCAEPYLADLGETMDWLLSEAGTTPGSARLTVPEDAPELTRYPMPAERRQDLLEAVPAKPYHDLKNPPRARAWWKYPIYTVIGLPRDLIDGAFGFVASIPVFNIPFVGVAYEVIPTQVIMRDPRDWHKWPGRRNKNGHGWLDSESWGWFPTAHQTKFTHPDEKKLALYKAENEALEKELHELNRGIEAANKAIDERQRAARVAAIAAIDAGQGEEAVARMLPAHLTAPADEAAHALLINALALHGDKGPAWVRPYLWRELSTVGQRVLRQSETLLTQSQKDFPRSTTLTEAVAFARVRMGETAAALALAKTAYELDDKNPRRARLYFETAMNAQEPEEATAAMEAVSDVGGQTDPVLPMTLRLALLNGKAGEVRPQIVTLTENEPDNPYYLYYLGCADLQLIGGAANPHESLESAVALLERASLSAGATPLQERASKTLGFARGLASRDEDQAPKKAKPRGFMGS